MPGVCSPGATLDAPKAAEGMALLLFFSFISVLTSFSPPLFLSLSISLPY